MAHQFNLDLGPEPFAFLYTEAANDPVFAKALIRHARAKRDEFTDDFRRREYRRLIKEQRGRCAHCGRHWRKAGLLQQDHRAALINGGGNAPSNLQLLCKPCHDRKTSQDIAMHRRLIAAK